MELYKTLVLCRKLPLTIECTYAYDDYLLIGTKEGHLLMYKIDIKLKTPTEYEFKPHLLRSAKQFSKKPIIQIEAILEYRVLVSLSDNLISIHNLDKISFPFISSLAKSKGANYFSLDINRQQTLSGQIQSTIRLCVAVKYSLLFFYWKNNEFHELRSNIKLPDIAKIIVWSMNLLFVGLRNQYIQVDIEKGTITKMFPVTSEPLIAPLTAEKNFAICREEKTYIFDHECRPLLERAITWKEQPLSIADDILFLIALEPNSTIEILANTLRDVIKEPLLQYIDLSKQVTKPLQTVIKWMNRPGQLVLNSENDIIMLKIVPNERQIRILETCRYFELAIKMIEYYNMSEMTINNENLDPSECEKLKEKISRLHAMDLFRRYKFNEAIKLFQSLDTDPSFVIALFPGVLPEKFRNQILATEATMVPILEGAILERGLMALIEYLVEIRLKVNKEIVHQKPSSDIGKLHELQKIIDTSLLKCYLETNESLVASLLRIENHCHLDETEIALKKKEKFNELVILYKTKGLHRNALNMLQNQALNGKNPVVARKQLIQYLQELGNNHIDLLFEYSEWLLKEYPEEGIKIFIDDMYVDPQNTLPKEDIIKYLESIDSDLVLIYLDHCIFKWNETSTKLIDTLINKYRAKIRLLMKNQQQNDNDNIDNDNVIEIFDINNENNSNNDNDDRIVKNDEYFLKPENTATNTNTNTGQQQDGQQGQNDDLNELRRKLINILENCDYYTTDTLSLYLLHDGLFEERAIVLGKMGNHREAIMIFIHVLNDLDAAEKYCLKQYEKELKKSMKKSSSLPPLSSSSRTKINGNNLVEDNNSSIIVGGGGVDNNTSYIRCELFFYLFEQCLKCPNEEELIIYSNKTSKSSSSKSKYSRLNLSKNVEKFLEQNSEKLKNLDENIRISIAILANHSTRIDLLKVIDMLDDNLPLGSLYLILPLALRYLGSKHNQVRILSRLWRCERLKVQEQRINVENANRIEITGMEICQACMKKIGKSVFVRYPNKELVHLGCRDQYEMIQQRQH